MRVSRAAPAATSLFISSKTTVAIPAPCALVPDALIQATLDPSVRAIEFLAQAHVGASQVDLDAIVIDRDDGRFVLDVVPARPVRDVEIEGLVLIALAELDLTPLVLTAADIEREPRFANSRLVWSYRLAPVGITLRMRVLQILADDGPMSLSRLLSAVRSDRDPESGGDGVGLLRPDRTRSRQPADRPFDHREDPIMTRKPKKVQRRKTTARKTVTGNGAASPEPRRVAETSNVPIRLSMYYRRRSRPMWRRTGQLFGRLGREADRAENGAPVGAHRNRLSGFRPGHQWRSPTKIEDKRRNRIDRPRPGPWLDRAGAEDIRQPVRHSLEVRRGSIP